MTLIGDVGGFNGAIAIFPVVFLSFYSATMYQSDVFSKTSDKKARKNEPLPAEESLKQSLQQGEAF